MQYSTHWDRISPDVAQVDFCPQMISQIVFESFHIFNLLGRVFLKKFVKSRMEKKSKVSSEKILPQCVAHI